MHTEFLRLLPTESFPKIPLTFLAVSPLGSNHNLQYEKWTETHKNKTKLLKRNTETARKTIETARKTMHRNGEKNHRNSQNKTTTSLRLYSQANKKFKVTMKQWNLLLTDWTCISLEFICNSARSYMEWIDSWSALTDVVQNLFEGGGGFSLVPTLEKKSESQFACDEGNILSR